MKAIVNERYGSPDILRASAVPDPVPGPGQIAIRVHASAVTTGDWRLRAAAFPGITALPGRLMFGIFRPRHKVLGGDFSGVVERVGAGASRFAPGDAVFGRVMTGAHAEIVVADEDGAVALKPMELSHEEAAALPFGALSALHFVGRVAGVRAGQRVAIVGATGGVGAYAVQLAAHLGAEVTAVGSAANEALARDLGAAHHVDYARGRLAGRFDAVIDTVGALSPRQAARHVARGGVFVPLNSGLREIGAALRGALRLGPRVALSIGTDRREDVEETVRLVAAGALRPVIDRVWDLARIADAYRQVEGRRRKGAVVLRVTPSPAPAARAA